MNKRAVYLGAISIVLLAGCGGGHSSLPPVAENPVTAPLSQNPDPANTSTQLGQPASTAAVASLTTSGTVPSRLLTGDYLGTPWGTTSVAPATASRYLTWALTGYGNVNTVKSAGIKVLTYFNPNRLQTNDPLYKLTSTTGFSKTCSSARIYHYFAGYQQFVTAPGSTALRDAYAAYVRTRLTYGIPDAIWEDNAGPLSEYGSFTPGSPCSYSDSGWISEEKGLENALSIPTIFNGLSGLNGHNVSLSTGLLDNAKTIGGNYEHCYTETANPEMGSWPWAAMENTELLTAAKGKLFFCMERNTNAASSSYPARQYALASLELTYNPNTTVMWSEFGTPSGLHVMPESQFIATSPVVSTPSNVSALYQSGSYKREYRACYYAGRSIGPCAMVVNPDYYSHPRPSLTYSYRHTINFHGNGILDGGSVTFDGPAAPTTLGQRSGYVLVP